MQSLPIIYIFDKVGKPPLDVFQGLVLTEIDTCLYVFDEAFSKGVIVRASLNEMAVRQFLYFCHFCLAFTIYAPFKPKNDCPSNVRSGKKIFVKTDLLQPVMERRKDTMDLMCHCQFARSRCNPMTIMCRQISSRSCSLMPKRT